MNSVPELSPMLLLGFACVFLLLPIAAVLVENSERTISRLPFFGWVLAFAFLPMIISAIGGTVASLVVALLLVWPVYQRYVQRARDAGMGKLIAFLSIIPLVSLITTLILLFAPGNASAYGEETRVWQG